jgi:hypothetical protein
MNKENMVYIYNGILSSYKKKKILSLVTMLISLENIMLSQIRQAQTQIPYDLTYMWNLKYLMSYRVEWWSSENRLAIGEGDSGDIGPRIYNFA